ncbi:MAG: hypothetical protein Q4A03_10210 [Rothia sp. (in: high G+C Gram-positive bacteria)]|uniref:hypothetical protein n=1 Tax=Rothia sp. (in: high G+C Gram-positive bacteria) TaxID=1885016 RepID=UPI0027002C33|nr:hypothetical protein [Rothia sp. (in: high G+C Gram-positive bacteria)]
MTVNAKDANRWQPTHRAARQTLQKILRHHTTAIGNDGLTDTERKTLASEYETQQNRAFSVQHRRALEQLEPTPVGLALKN